MGFISTKAHTVIGLIVGVALIAAPWLFGFSNVEAATLVPIVVGAFIIVNELLTTSPYSPLKLIPMRIHIIVDVVTGIFLAASPWLFGFMTSDAPNQWVPHLVVGIMIVGYALLTRVDEEAPSIAQ